MKLIFKTALSITFVATIIFNPRELEANIFNIKQNINTSQHHLLRKQPQRRKSVSLEIAQKLQSSLDETVSKYGVGASVKVISTSGKWVATSGLSNLENQTPVQPEDKFQIASVTKTFTAVTILKLAEEGKLSLDDTLEKWLPNIAQNIPDGNNITIRQLLNGSSGIYDFAKDANSPFFQEVIKNPQKQWKYEELVAYAYGKERKEWVYPNSGFILAGMIIEKATGSTIAAEIRRLISEPLGLENTFFYSEEIPGGLVSGYIDIPPGDGNLDNVSFVNISFAGAAGGLISTPEDVSKFFQILLSGKLLQKSSLREMLTFVDTKEEGDGLISRRYGLGIQLIEAETPELGKFKLIGHGGTNPASGFGAGMWLYPEFGVMIVYAENVQKTQPEEERDEEDKGVALTILETLSEIKQNIKDN